MAFSDLFLSMRKPKFADSHTCVWIHVKTFLEPYLDLSFPGFCLLKIFLLTGVFSVIQVSVKFSNFL